MISFVGASLGLAIGWLLCFLQDQVGLVGMGMENAIVSHYPVDVRAIDFASTILVIVVVSLLVSFRPAVLASRTFSVNQL